MRLLKDQHIKEHIIYGQGRMSKETDFHKKGCFLPYTHSLLFIQIGFPWSDFVPFFLLKQTNKQMRNGDIPTSLIDINWDQHVKDMEKIEANRW